MVWDKGVYSAKVYYQLLGGYWYHFMGRKTELRETALHNGLEKRYEMALNEIANYKFPILVCFISVHIAAAF